MDEQNTTPDENNDTSNSLPDPVIESAVVDTDEHIDTELVDTEHIDTEHVDTVASEDATSPRRSRFRSPVLAGALAGLVGLGIGAGAVALAGNDHDSDRHDDDTQQMSVDQQMPGGHMDRDHDGDRSGQGRMMPGQQTGGFMQPQQNGGQPQGRTGGS